jgi:DNA-binding beta-propeller fold protein YncE
MSPGADSTHARGSSTYCRPVSLRPRALPAGNDSVGVIDFGTREIAHVITGLKRPQGLAYVPSADTLFVANGGDGSLRMFEGTQHRAVEPILVGEDADNLRFDPESNLI